MRFRTFTLGCKVNQYETQYVRSALLANGYEESVPGEEATADLIVVNTCSVTAESDAKSRKVIAKLAKESPRAKIYAMGCYVSGNPDSARQLPHVYDILTDKRELDRFLEEKLVLSVLPRKITKFDEHSRAFVKIQDGCRVGCAYCIIPKVRPYLHSRHWNNVLDEVESLAGHGYREIVLTGIHLGHYGLDFHMPQAIAQTPLDEYLACRDILPASQRESLARLLQRLLAAPSSVRFRLGSLEAVEVDELLLNVVAESNGRICPHFHLSMQSGDDMILKRMGRRWASGPFCEKCFEIKTRLPDVALTTDVIVGFPGETDKQFAKSCEWVERIGFSKVHVFRFSARPGTKAALMPDVIPERVKKERSEHLQSLAASVRSRYMARFVHKQVEVLVEHCNLGSDIVSGTTEHYLPVEMIGDGPACGELVSVKVEASDSSVLHAQVPARKTE